MAAELGLALHGALDSAPVAPGVGLGLAPDVGLALLVAPGLVPGVGLGLATVAPGSDVARGLAPGVARGLAPDVGWGAPDVPRVGAPDMGSLPLVLAPGIRSAPAIHSPPRIHSAPGVDVALNLEPVAPGGGPWLGVALGHELAVGQTRPGFGLVAALGAGPLLGAE